MLIYQRVILLSKTVNQRIKDRKDLGWTVLKVKKTFPTIQVQHFHTPNDWNDIKHMETKTIFFLRNQQRTLVWDDPWNNHLEIIKNSHGGDSLGYYSPVTSFFLLAPGINRCWVVQTFRNKKNNDPYLAWAIVQSPCKILDHYMDIRSNKQ